MMPAAVPPEPRLGATCARVCVEVVGARNDRHRGAGFVTRSKHPALEFGGAAPPWCTLDLHGVNLRLSQHGTRPQIQLFGEFNGILFATLVI